MKNEVFDRKIQPLMEVIERICQEEGISFLAEFNIDKENGTIYTSVNGDMILSGDTIMSQYQKWDLRNGR